MFPPCAVAGVRNRTWDRALLYETATPLVYRHTTTTLPKGSFHHLKMTGA